MALLKQEVSLLKMYLKEMYVSNEQFDFIYK
jgi:hypothetical protein